MKTEKTFSIKSALVALFMLVSATVMAQTSVTGTVVDDAGEAVIGATIREAGTQNATVTDFDGNFLIRVQNPNAVLSVSYVGFKTTEVKLGGRKTIAITMKSDDALLNEVVVVGYGTMKKKLVTGATTEIKGDNIAKLNTTNPLSAMQGQMAGVNIVSTSGQPGADMSVTIRGLGTVGNSQPLYLIDGVAGDISLLNPSDIERIDVLKDAASAAIYGAQAANGVVIVTTKSGVKGTGKINYDGYIGYQTVARKFKMLNASEYMTIMDEARLNSGMSPVDWSSLNSIHDVNGNVYDTDWIDEAIHDGAITTSHNLSFMGGSENTTYAISGGYTGQDGVIGGSDVSYYRRYNFRTNSEHKMFNDIVTIGEHASFVWKDSRGMGTGNIWNNNLRSAFSTSPLTPVYDADGNYNSTVGSDWNVNDGNPYGTMMVNRYNRSRGATVDANVYLQIEPIKNLKLKTVYGIYFNSSDYRSYTPIYKFTPQSGNTDSSVNQSNGHGLSMIWTNTLSYDFTIAKNNNFNVLIGSEWTRYNGNGVQGYNTSLIAGFNDWDHAYLSNTNGTQNKTVTGGPYDETRGMSYFARLGWSYKDRYMINATMRADASSMFAAKGRWGYFPSVSAGWTLTEEKFMNNAKSWMDFLKIRASWGQVGNQNIGCYQYLAPVTTSKVNYNFGTDAGQTGWSTGSYPSRLANEDIKWETSEQLDFGIDARFIGSRLGLTADYYIKTTKDWLVKAPILATAGTGAPYINGGDVKNKGVEVSLTWNDRIGKNFNYNIGGNFAYNQNKVGEIPTEDGIIHGETNQIYSNAEEFYRAENGHAIGYFWGYQTAGIFQNNAEIDEWVAAGNGVYQDKVQPGDVKYVDQNHDGVINSADKVDLGNGLPKYTFGFNIGFEWKGLDFALNATGAAGFKIAQSYRDPNSSQANYSRSILNRWTGEGTSNKMPRVTYQDVGNWQFSDLYLQDGDYLRLQTVTLGYDFSKLLHSNVFSKLRLYVQAQNLLTFTKYDGMDPEIGSYNGTNGNSSDSWVSGVDMGYYPHPRTFIVGVNVQLDSKSKKHNEPVQYMPAPAPEPKIIEKIVEKPVEKIVYKEVEKVNTEIKNRTFVVNFPSGKAETPEKNILDDVPAGSEVEVVAYASPDGDPQKNIELSQKRADSVAEYLKAKGIKVNRAEAKGANSTYSNRIAIVTVLK